MDETIFISEYRDLTGCSESRARSVFIFLSEAKIRDGSIPQELRRHSPAIPGTGLTLGLTALQVADQILGGPTGTP